jgi:hypothetical protein
MSVARTARRRRQQAANGYKHMAPLKRPHYKKRDAGAAARHLARVIANERRIKGR